MSSIATSTWSNIWREKKGSVGQRLTISWRWWHNVSLLLNLTLFWTFSINERSPTAARLTFSHFTRGFIVIPLSRMERKVFGMVGERFQIQRNQSSNWTKKPDGHVTCRITVKYTTMRVVHTIRFFSFILFPSSMVARPYATAPRRPP